MADPHITVPLATPDITYSVGAGGQSAFAVPFTVFEASDLQVYVGDVLKTLTTDYTVTLTAGYSGGYPSATVHLVAPAVSTDVRIIRAIIVERITDFPATGPFNINALNTELDRVFASLQETRAYVDRLAQQAVDGVILDGSLTNAKLATMGPRTVKGSLVGGAVQDLGLQSVASALLGPTFYAADYGFAEANTAANNDTALSACITAALAGTTAGTGGKIVLPAGQFSINGPFVINTSSRVIHIEGAGRRATRLNKQTATGHVFDLTTCPEWRFSAFSIEAAVEQNAGSFFKLSASSYGIVFENLWLAGAFNHFYMRGCTNIRLLNVDCQGHFASVPDNSAKSGAYMLHLDAGAGNNGIWVSNCSFDPSSLTPATRSNYQHVWYIAESDGFWAENCHVAGSYNAQIYLVGVGNVGGCTFTSVWCDLYGEYNVLIAGGTTMIGNVFVNCRFQGARNNAVQINNQNARGTQFHGCIAEFSGAEGLYVGAGQDTLWDGQIWGTCTTSGSSCATFTGANTIGGDIRGLFDANAKTYCLVFGSSATGFIYGGVMRNRTAANVDTTGATNIVNGGVVTF